MKLKNVIAWIFLLAATTAYVAPKLQAQSANFGGIAGTVTDTTGAIIPGAKIVAKNVASGTTLDTTTSSAGTYKFPSVPIGTYDVTVSAPGFKQTVRTGLIVQVASLAPLNVSLEVGGVSQTVTVAANAQALETESSDIGNVVTQKQVIDLPLGLGGVGATRSPEAFVFLAPGTVGPGTNNGSGGVFESKLSGGQNYGTDVLLDGASIFRSENGSSFDETAPSVDAISQFKVITSTMPAQYGRTTGGIETFATSSGTNAYHGVAYEIFQNNDMNGNTWFNNYNISQDPTNPAVRAANATPLDKKNDFGLTMGGPFRIPKVYNGTNKTFFFFSWEQFRQNIAGTVTSTVPTPAERKGDLSAYLTNTVLGTNPCDGQPIYQGEVFDPSTTQTVNGVTCRLPFAGNIIPTSRISPISQAVLSYVPLPQTSAQFSNFTYAQPYPIRNTLTSVRVDQNLGIKHKVFFSYNSRDNTRLSCNPSFPGPANNGCQLQNFFEHYYRAGWDWTLTPSMLNHVDLGYNRETSDNNSQAVTYHKDWPNVLGIGNVNGATFPQFNIGEGISQIGYTVNNFTYDNGYRADESLNWVKGKHDLQFGTDLRYQIFEPISYNNESGTFSFGRGQTAATLATDATSGNGLGSFLLGTLANENLTDYATQPKWLSSYIAFYAQDDWKVSSTLTLNLGLRWDEDVPRSEHRGNTSNISITAPNPGAGNIPGALVFAGKGPGRNGHVNERWANTWHKDFAPRLGFAWSPKIFDNQTVIRGGYGIYYAALLYADFGGDMQTGFQANPSLSPVNGFDATYTLGNGFPAYPAPPNLDPAQQNFQTPTYIAPSYGRPAMTQNWSLELQQQLATDLILDIGYVGVSASHLHSQIDPVNPLAQSFFKLSGLLNDNVYSPAATAAGIKPPYTGFQGTVAQALRPFPQYLGINTDCCLENLGVSNYNALEVSLNRRFHSGLNLLASYTWEKTMTDADSELPVFATFAGGGSPQNPFNYNSNVSISDQDLPNTFVLSYLYDLPFGKGKRFLNQNKIVDKVVGGWELGGVQRYESGQPLAFGCATGIPGVNNCIYYNRAVGQPLLRSGQSTSKFLGYSNDIFNNAALRDPNRAALINAGNPYRFGDLPRVTSEARSEMYSDEDFSLNKRTHITSTKDLLFQASAFDAFNRHVFNRPDTSGPNSPTFGFINNTINGPRIIQLMLQFEY